MKKLIAIFITALMLVSLCSCGSGSALSKGQITDEEITALVDSYIEYSRIVYYGDFEYDSSNKRELNGETCYKVTDERFSTAAEWEEYVYSILCGEPAASTAYSVFQEFNGELYRGISTKSREYCWTDDYIYEILRNDDGRALIRITNPELDGSGADVDIFTFSLTSKGWRIGDAYDEE